MLIDQYQREILRICPDCYLGLQIQMRIALLKLKREIGKELSKTWLIKFIIKLLDKCS